MTRYLWQKVIINTILSVSSVIAINLLVLYLLDFPQMAILEIKKYLPLLFFLISGFGVQVGLYTFLVHKNPISPITTVASGGTSSVAMILCCSHYLINIAPFISASALSIFADYTREILLFGVISNISGISFMIYKIKKVVKNEQQIQF